MRKVFQKLNEMLSKRDKIFLLFMLVFSLLISIIETLGISLIMPFISIASNFSLITQNKYMNKLYLHLGAPSLVRFTLYFGFTIIVFYIFRCIANLLYMYYLGKFSQGRYHVLASKLFSNYMRLPYVEFVKHNSALISKNIISEASNLTSIIYSVMLIFSELFIVVIMYAILLIFKWKITLALTIFVLIAFFFGMKYHSKLILVFGERRNYFQDHFYKIIIESISNIKMIKMLGSEREIINNFESASFGYTRANITGIFLNNSQKPLLELIGLLLLISVVMFVVFHYRNPGIVIPIVSIYALAFLRFMPSFNRIVTNFGLILFYKNSLDLVYSDYFLEVENLGNCKIEFNDSIELRNVSFAFDGHNIINNLSYKILKGQRVAFIGRSGAGKSTLIDIIMGINAPKDGVIMVDGIGLNASNIRSWRSKIGYIPQHIYLTDGTIRENVVFGRELDDTKVENVLKRANIFDFLLTKQGLDTRVGEGGIMLSGGQKQRVAIARALYGDPEIIVLDEATSALDEEAEQKIMDELYDLSRDKTLLIVAHRLSTIEKCDHIFKVGKSA